MQQLKAMDGGLQIGGDGRADSPGHCAKFGSYTTMEMQLGKVLDIQLVQVNFGFRSIFHDVIKAMQN